MTVIVSVMQVQEDTLSSFSYLHR